MLELMEGVYLAARGGWGGNKPLTRGEPCNCYLVDGGGELALVDTGTPECVEDTLQNIRQAGFDLAKLKKIVLTHGHWDHVCGTAAWLKHVDAEVCAHALTQELLQGKPGIYQGYTPPVQVLAPVHRVIREGDKIIIGRTVLEVLELPGHTPDGLALSFRSGGALYAFSGDTAIGDQGSVRGVIGWIDDHWGSKLSAFKSSLERLRSLKLSGFFGGHGLPHLGQADVQRSLDNCLWRLELLRSIPDLGSMLPVQF